MNREEFLELKVGDKIKILDDFEGCGCTNYSHDMERYYDKIVTIANINTGWYGEFITIEEDNGTWKWFKEFIDYKVDDETIIPEFKPKFTKKKNFRIEFIKSNHNDRDLSWFALAKVTDNMELLTRYNSERFSKVVAGKWVFISTNSGRVYNEYNPHLCMEENRCRSYRLDNYMNLLVDMKSLSEEHLVYKVMNVDFKNGKVSFPKISGNICHICGRPMTSNEFGKVCYDCVHNNLELTTRFSYHEYCDGYPTPSKVNTQKVPVFGCEIERDYIEPDDYDKCSDDDEYRDADDRFYDNLCSATKEIVKCMQLDDFKKGKIKRDNVFMYDGSLDYGGLEWITFPHTFEWYVKNRDKFDRALDRIESYGFKNTSSVGNHIHMNRDFFTVNGKDYSEYCASKIAILFSKYWEEFKAIAKRDDTEYTDKPNCKHDDNPIYLLEGLMEYKNEHSVAVNLQHDKTVEIRLWGGIDSAYDLLFFLDNMQALARYAKATGIERVQCAKITDYMRYFKLDTSLREVLNRLNMRSYNVNSKCIEDVKEMIAKKENKQ